MLNIKLPENCDKEPVRFFKIIAHTDLISTVKNYFISMFNNADYKDLLQVASWKYDTEIDEFFVSRNADSILPQGRPLSVIQETKKIIEYQIDLSIHFLDKKANGDCREKSKKEFFKNIINILSSSAKAINHSDLNKKYYNELSYPFAKIGSYIYIKHGDYINKKDDYLNDLFSKYEQTNLAYKPKDLSINVIKDIFTIEDKKKKTIFQFENPDSEKLLKYFMYGQFEKIKTPINILSKVEPAYYLIFKLCQYLNLTESDVMKENIFKINGQKYYDTSAYSAKNRIAKRRNGIKSQIDSIIYSNLS